MSNQELEIRAATALGWVNPNPMGYYTIPIETVKILNLKNNGQKRAYKLKFTTSYDWVMLLVKKIVSLDKPEFEDFYYRFDEGLWGFVNADIAKIAQDCVEVLEEAKEKGSDDGE